MSSLVLKQLAKQLVQLVLRHPYSTYTVYLTTLSPPAFFVDSALIWLCHKTTENNTVAH
ncbi:hypothetical protein CIHG_10234 [Coccidioides immitis H538.4]|uniref:Uncharacterized protein n=1 Tax=Coccidioides immitis H538.4 TaxID=396776 RepID=A0A0J8UWW5_COCIT|nr:hypothetical protein CIHG_10234 [Coccidioides immitis H538.4]